VTGDSIQVIGKTMNYGLDSITVNRTFSVDGKIQQAAAINLRNAHVDSFQVVVAQQDSAHFKYTIQRNNGYFDGEERSIPVFKQGVQETKGFFATLEKDTSFTLQPDAGLGKMTVYAETSVLPVLLDEIESLRQYEYLCNEQMASKLKALLLKKKVYGYLNKEFKEEKNIRELITKLNQSKSEGMLWGWWNNNSPVLWISQHVTEALLTAEQQGYQVNINKQSMIDYLVLNFDHYRIGEKIVSVQLLQLLGSKVEYKRYTDTLDKYLADATMYEKLRVLQLKQKAGFPIMIDTFITKQHHTMFGNIYWGDEKYHFFNNSIQLTLAMYKLLQKAGNQEQLLKKIRYYFLEKRKDGKWRNTYESALILETILPDLLTSEAAMQPASLTIAGSQSNVVTTFPYTTTFSSGEKLTVTKQKGMPVYFTAYQQSWNPAPQKVAGDFTVQSTFERNGQTKTILKAGEAVTLKVKVIVKADADYVMVEVPIPAGCSYQEKNQAWSNNEVHREYFKNKVSVFCSSLAKGEYTFTVSLLPRYTGRYHLNPAKAEMMYFPVFYGREEMKKVRID
jgi:alpha-2-macroglobulin